MGSGWVYREAEPAGSGSMEGTTLLGKKFFMWKYLKTAAWEVFSQNFFLFLQDFIKTQTFGEQIQRLLAKRLILFG